MSILDDVLLALIARFVVDDLDHLSVSDESFLQHQLIAVNELVKDVPEEQRHQVIMTWIEDHAAHYRDEWRKKVYSQLLVNHRCADCPLDNNDAKSICVIHHKWTALLNDYIAGKIESEKYIEDALKLLEKHKNHLKISRISAKL